jgi:formylglycine-generating enzyme required for sulfatase activity
MKKTFISFFSLLLFAAAVATTTTAQEAKPKLAVFVVGMDDWMLGDVLAHLVGEELNRDKNYDVVTRRNDIQNKLEALRRGYDRLDENLLRAWATEKGINNLCLVTTTLGLNFSAKLLDVSSGEVLCSMSRVDPNAVALKQLAWSLAGNLGSGCTPSWSDYTEPSIGIPVEMEMVYVEGGEFRMGCAGVRDGGTNGVSSGNNGECSVNEEPDHDVTVGSFWIGKYEVTQGQWEAVMGEEEDIYYQMAAADGGSNDNPLKGEGPDFPMYYVNWSGAQAFCAALSARTGKTYRLPTEAEWEYAARGGKLSAGYMYSGGNDIGSVAWNGSNASGINHEVGAKSGNELGIYDMSGNVQEWCFDRWSANYASERTGSFRVIRGGSWNYDESSCRVASRDYHGPSIRAYYVGFRVV